MKNNSIKTLFVAALALAFTACMNLEPIDPNTTQMSNENSDQIIDALYAKLYVSFVQTGQTGGGGDADIISNDEGYSGFFRTLNVLNEFPTDAGWWTFQVIQPFELRCNDVEPLPGSDRRYYGSGNDSQTR